MHFVGRASVAATTTTILSLVAVLQLLLHHPNNINNNNASTLSAVAVAAAYYSTATTIRRPRLGRIASTVWNDHYHHDNNNNNDNNNRPFTTSTIILFSNRGGGSDNNNDDLTAAPSSFDTDISVPSSSTADNIDTNDDDNDNNITNTMTVPPSPSTTSSLEYSYYSPRVRSCIYMSLAMALHFGGYEFARSGALALFTSSTTGLGHPSAYPLAIGLVTPASLLLLYGYGKVLKASGPRVALYRTTALAVAVLGTGTALCQGLFVTALNTATTSSSSSSIPSIALLSKAVVAALFVFQNSYAHLIYTQQWSFLGSVMTPSEGTQWFSTIAGVSSLVCTVTATMVHSLSAHVGLLGLMVGTCLTLAMSMVVADRAYLLSQVHGFDPSSPVLSKKKKATKNDENNTTTKDNTAASAVAPETEDESLLAKTGRMFRTSSTLAGLFGEVITFQSLSTVLNVCFVRLLKDSIPNDTARVAFTGRFYAMVNGLSALMQFLVLPLARKYLEPQWVYRFLPLLLMPLLVVLAVQPTSTLWLAALAFLALKTADYSIRNVANEMVYQPLDFDARYLGKEVIGVFANRFGKSGMSLILSGLTVMLPNGWMGARQLSQLSVVVGSAWLTSSMWLSRHVITNKEAEATVVKRKQQEEELAGVDERRSPTGETDKKMQ